MRNPDIKANFDQNAAVKTAQALLKDSQVKGLPPQEMFKKFLEQAGSLYSPIHFLEPGKFEPFLVQSKKKTFRTKENMSALDYMKQVSAPSIFKKAPLQTKTNMTAADYIETEKSIKDQILKEIGTLAGPGKPKTPSLPGKTALDYIQEKIPPFYAEYFDSFPAEKPSAPQQKPKPRLYSFALEKMALSVPKTKMLEKEALAPSASRSPAAPAAKKAKPKKKSARKKPAKKISQVLNFLWLNLDIPAKPDPKDGTIRQPLPEKYIDNVRRAGEKQPQADIVLWVDSKRLTEKQYAYLKAAIEKDRPNVRLKDLRKIDRYKKEKLFDQPETADYWRENQETMIWRQVDAAKVLISLQGGYDQTFFADLDYSHLDIGGKRVQDKMGKRGLLIGSGGCSEETFENQLWGFTRLRRRFFVESYDRALKRAYAGHNAYSDFVNKIEHDLLLGENIPKNEISFSMANDSSQARQPGHEWEGNRWSSSPKPKTVPAARLSEVFGGVKNRHGGKPRKVLSSEDAFALVSIPAPNAALPKVTGSKASLVPKILARAAKAGKETAWGF